MRRRISEQNKIIGNFPSKGFEKDGKYFVMFQNPVVIGAIKDIMILPPKQGKAITNLENELDAYSTQRKIIIEKIEQLKTDESLTDVQRVEQTKAYNQELIKVFKEEAKNRVTGEKKTKNFRPKILRCRVIGQNKEGYYEIEPIKIPNSWKV